MGFHSLAKERQPDHRVNGQEGRNNQCEQAAEQPASGEHDGNGGGAVHGKREHVQRRSPLTERLVERKREIEVRRARMAPAKARIRTEELHTSSGVQRAELKRGAVAGEQEIRNAPLSELPHLWNERPNAAIPSSQG
jgi:hypothetical protein